MKVRGADLLARTLAAAGARHVFTLSGNPVMSVFDAAKASLENAQSAKTVACVNVMIEGAAAPTY